MRVHFGQARQQIPLRAINNRRAVRYRDIINVADSQNATISDNNSLSGNRRFLVHRDDVDVNEDCGVRGSGRQHCAEHHRTDKCGE